MQKKVSNNYRTNGLYAIRGECPTPEKLSFTSKRRAKAKAKQHHGVRVYKCVCGEWHTTSQKLSESRGQI